MHPREWAVSALVVVVLAIPIAEAFWRVDDWPASRVAMFSRRVSPTTPVRRVKLVGTNVRGDVVELRPFDVGLDPIQFNRQLPTDPALLAAACGGLGRLYNERMRFPAFRLSALRAEMTTVPRPGQPPPTPASWSVACPLGAR